MMGSDIPEGNEDESPFMESRVGNLQIALF